MTQSRRLQSDDSREAVQAPCEGKVDDAVPRRLQQVDAELGLETPESDTQGASKHSTFGPTESRQHSTEAGEGATFNDVVERWLLTGKRGFKRPRGIPVASVRAGRPPLAWCKRAPVVRGEQRGTARDSESSLELLHAEPRTTGEPMLADVEALGDEPSGAAVAQPALASAEAINGFVNVLGRQQSGGGGHVQSLHREAVCRPVRLVRFRLRMSVEKDCSRLRLLGVQNCSSSANPDPSPLRQIGLSNSLSSTLLCLEATRIFRRRLLRTSLRRKAVLCSHSLTSIACQTASDQSAGDDGDIFHSGYIVGDKASVVGWRRSDSGRLKGASPGPAPISAGYPMAAGVTVRLGLCDGSRSQRDSSRDLRAVKFMHHRPRPPSFPHPARAPGAVGVRECSHEPKAHHAAILET
ncbi:uncharacterized protein BDZ99DRAFT_499614, partial [Mytilinidion resinicola]